MHGMTIKYPSRLTLESIITVCKLYDYPNIEIEKVELIEDCVYPTILDQFAKKLAKK
jgi:hypothetical protein